MMAGSNKGANNGLKVLIVFLVVAVVGLVAGVVVVNIQRNNQSEEIVKTDNEIFGEILNGLFGKSTDEAISYIDDWLDKDIGTDLARQIFLLKANVFMAADMNDEAIEVLESADVENMNSVEKIQVYLTLGQLYDEVGDQEKAEYYDEEVNIIKDESGYIGVGQ